MFSSVLWLANASSSSTPFDGPWQTFIDIVRLTGMFVAFGEITLLLWLFANKGMRRNTAWLWAAAACCFGDYVAAYTEYDRLGYNVGRAGRLWAILLMLVCIGGFTYKSFRIRGTVESSMFEEFRRTRWGSGNVPPRDGTG